jgi:hypothetical protein
LVEKNIKGVSMELRRKMAFEINKAIMKKAGLVLFDGGKYETVMQNMDAMISSFMKFGKQADMTPGELRACADLVAAHVWINALIKSGEVTDDEVMDIMGDEFKSPPTIDQLKKKSNPLDDPKIKQEVDALRQMADALGIDKEANDLLKALEGLAKQEGDRRLH